MTITFKPRPLASVPTPTRATAEARLLQHQYDDFIRSLDITQAGELSLDGDEVIRSVKLRLRRASARLGIDIDIWDADDKVYFRRVVQRVIRNRRPHRSPAPTPAPSGTP